MNHHRAVLYFVLALFLLGAGCVGSRYYVRHKMRLSRGDSVWRLTYEVRFASPGGKSRIRIALPSDTPQCRAFRETILRPGLEADVVRRSRRPGREFVGLAPKPGTFAVRAIYDLHLSPRTAWKPVTLEKDLPAELRQSYLGSGPGIEVDSPVVAEVLGRLRTGKVGKDAIVEKIFGYCTQQIQATQQAPAPRGSRHSSAAEVLRYGEGTVIGRARAMIALCRAAELPARLVTGLEIKRAPSAQPHYWVEVLSGREWLPFDPENEFSRELPAAFLPILRGGADLVGALDAEEPSVRFRVAPIPPPPGLLAGGVRQWHAILDLTRLPIAMQRTLSPLLVLPIGALVAAFFRNIIGLRTFGTFAPALLALGFMFSDLGTGLIILGAVLIAGLACRALLARLELLTVPRLGLVLTIVVISLIFSVSIMDYWDLTPSARAVLLPMVILATMIERLHIVLEEDGPASTLKLLLGTAVVGFCCLLLFLWEGLAYVVVTYPEVHFFTAALLILTGRYVGYRLTELWRFHDLVKAAGAAPAD